MVQWNAQKLYQRSRPAPPEDFLDELQRARRRSGGSGLAARTPVGSLIMSDLNTEPPRAHARIVYLGPVSPHGEVYGDYGDRTLLDEFRARVLARLVLLPRDDPQFRRNRERVARDAERENITIEWDLGIPENN